MKKRKLRPTSWPNTDLGMSKYRVPEFMHTMASPPLIVNLPSPVHTLDKKRKRNTFRENISRKKKNRKKVLHKNQ